MTDSPDALLLDEMFSPRIAALLGEVGIDCASVAADATLRTQDDAAVVDAALAQRRILVTNNVADFEIIRRGREVPLALPHPGLIYTDDSTFPRKRGLVARIANALEYAAKQHLTWRHGGVHWLSGPPASAVPANANLGVRWLTSPVALGLRAPG